MDSCITLFFKSIPLHSLCSPLPQVRTPWICNIVATYYLLTCSLHSLTHFYIPPEICQLELCKAFYTMPLDGQQLSNDSRMKSKPWTSKTPHNYLIPSRKVKLLCFETEEGLFRSDNFNIRGVLTLSIICLISYLQIYWEIKSFSAERNKNKQLWKQIFRKKYIDKRNKRGRKQRDWLPVWVSLPPKSFLWKPREVMPHMKAFSYKVRWKWSKNQMCLYVKANEKDLGVKERNCNYSKYLLLILKLE